MTTLIPTIESTTDGLVVTSETIAVGSGAQHASVLRLLDDNKADFEQFGHLRFEIRDAYNNHKARVALLNEQQATLLMTFQRNTEQVKAFKIALVKAFYDMAQRIAAPKLPQTYPEALRELAATAEAREAAEAKVKELEPKGKYVDEFVAGDDRMLLRTVASTLGVGEQNLRTVLRYSEWIYLEESSRRNSKGEVVPQRRWSEYAAKKSYFYRRMNHEAPFFMGTLDYTLMVTPEGAQAIARLVERVKAQYGTLAQAIPSLERKWEERRKLKVVPAA